MKNFVIAIIITIINSMCSLAFGSNNISNVNLKLGVQKYPWMGDIPFIGREQMAFTPLGYLEVNYEVIKNIDLGANIGYSLYKHADFSELEKAINGEVDYPVSSPMSLKPMLTYGINLNMHLLPIVFQKDVRIIDVYVASKVGGIYFSNRNKEVVFFERPLFDYGIYGGVALFPRNRWGLYYEYGYGNYIKWKAGLSLKIDRKK